MTKGIKHIKAFGKIFSYRSVGILPVKERASDPLTWHVVPSQSSLTFTQDRDSQPTRDVRILLNVAPRTKLGCGICKGPDWKPGIFVQFTKENGIAKESGLQPGDQIASCNGIDFTDILFSEAVAVMKSSTVLELFIRPGAGLDLFPSESSGYNSSASSVTGDQSPCWGDTKRLSIVREESTNSNDRVNGAFKLRSNRKDKPLQVEVPKVPANYIKSQNYLNNNNTSNNVYSNNDSSKSTQNTTIIKLTENGPTLINNTMIPSLSNGYKEANSDPQKPDASKKIADICFVSRQNETKIVTVEVHQSSSTNGGQQIQALNAKFTNGNVSKTLDEISRDESESSASSNSCLSSAISEELKRRSEKKLREQQNQVNNEAPTSPSAGRSTQEQLPQKAAPTTSNNNNNNIHEILMDEFKKAHKKMFKNGFIENEYQQQQQQQQMTDDDTRNTNVMSVPATNGVNAIEERQLELKKNGTPRALLNNGTTEKKKQAPLPPPKRFDKQLSNQHVKFDEVKEPWTPKPDYDSPDGSLRQQTDQQKGTMGRKALQELAKAKGDVAEMESLESFKLNSPSSKIPIPPPMYFQTSKFEPTTLKKAQQKPVSVIVSSYNTNKKEPGKLDFVDNSNERSFDENANVDMSTRLKYELEKTLSRSNLRRSLDNILKPDSDPSYDNVNDRQIVLMSKKHEPSTLNGILKKSTVNGSGTTKNISFNDIPK